MSRHESDLNAALRMLAEAGPREAPQHIEVALREAFRRQRGARRLRGGIVVAIAAGAMAASIAVFTWVAPRAGGPPERVVRWTVAPPALAWSRESGVGSRESKPGRRRRRPTTNQLAATTTEFVPLPYGDDALISENTTIVRMELPRSALRLAGFSVAQERADDRVQADVVLGTDGLAHAVRFVRYTQ
jgi:hypothetical protein